MLKRACSSLSDHRGVVVDVVVVGAGLSGLVAARHLVAHGMSIRVLEARERVGGRTLTVPLGRGSADLGGQWMAPTQERLAGLARELGIETHAQYREGRMIVARAATRATTWLTRVPGLHVLELGHRLRQLDRMSRVRESPASDRAAWAREHSLGDWLAAYVRTDQAREALGLLSALHLGVEPDEVSLAEFLRFLRATSGTTGTAQTGASGQEMRFVGGGQALCTRLAEPLGERVSLGYQVASIEHDDAGVAVRTIRANEPLRARYAVLAMAPTLIDQLQIAPALPEARRDATRGARLSPVIKCALAYEHPFWRQAGFSGEAYRLDGAVRAVVDHTSLDRISASRTSVSSQPALMAFIIGDAARALSGVSMDERRARVIDELVELFGEAAHAVVDYTDKDWPADPLSPGCVTVMGPGSGSAPNAWRIMSEPVGRLHFAGTETATLWPHYLDGAIEAGERVADEILAQARHCQ